MNAPTKIVPPIAAVAAIEVVEPFCVRVTWRKGVHPGAIELVDLGPAIKSFKLYKPVAESEELFRDVQIRDDGHMIGWGDNLDLEMSASSIERMAEETMTADRFRTFLREHKLTHGAAAAVLGRSRRQIENYLSGSIIPRVVALACIGWETRKRKAFGVRRVYSAIDMNLATTVNAEEDGVPGEAVKVLGSTNPVTTAA